MLQLLPPQHARAHAHTHASWGQDGGMGGVGKGSDFEPHYEKVNMQVC